MGEKTPSQPVRLQIAASSAVTLYSRCTSSNVMPPARLPTTTVTGKRVPRMSGLPWQMAGSMTAVRRGDGDSDDSDLAGLVEFGFPQR
jgi:hypothetical protein